MQFDKHHLLDQFVTINILRVVDKYGASEIAFVIFILEYREVYPLFFSAYD